MAYNDEITLLVVEDDEVDQMIISRALAKQGITNKVILAQDGLEALDILRGVDGNQALKRPYVVLLDMHMPRMGGMEFLKVIRDDETLKRTIVFVLSTSGLLRDITQAYEFGISGYVVKEDAGRDFVKMAQLIDSFKITVRFPEQ